MKNIKRIFTVALILCILLSVCNNALATDLKTKLNIVQKASETIYLENDQGYISKTIVDSNEDTGEITIELKLSNIKKENQETQQYKSTELYIIISENIVNDNTKLEKYTKNIEKLIDGILNTNSNTKIGIIGIKGTITDTKFDESGNMQVGPNDEGGVEGSASNSEIVVELTNDKNVIINGIKNMNPSKTKYRTNLQAAIKLANQSYSNNSNKILISLYDNVPSIAIGVKSKVSYGWMSEYSTVEEAVKAKHEKIANYTKDEILKLKNSNVSFILLRPDDTSYDETWYSESTGEKILEFDGKPYVQKLYGTMDNPTYGKMYSFVENNIDTVITENIYKEVENIIQSSINIVKITDYFPEEITENFEFSYVGKPSIGTTSNTIDEDKKTITWDIGTLKGDENATLKYKLKIKDMQNTAILNKTIATNKKVELTYKDKDDKAYVVTLSSSPTIQLLEVKEELTATVSYNPSIQTTEKVTATIKTNKKVNEVNGWTLSQDGMTLTKEFSNNATETVHLVDMDNMTKDVIVEINNIKPNENLEQNDLKPNEIQSNETQSNETQQNETQQNDTQQNDTEQNNVEKNNINKDNLDTTTAPNKIPQTGESIIIIASVILIIGIGISAYIRYNKYKDI